MTNAEEENAFAEAMNQFAAHLNKDKMTLDDPAEESPPVSFTLHRKFPENPAGEGDSDGIEGKTAATTSGHQRQAETTPSAKPTSTRRRFPEFSSRGAGSKATAAQPAAAEAGRRASGGGGGEVEMGSADRRASGTSEGGETKVAAAATGNMVDDAARDDGPAVARRALRSPAVFGLGSTGLVLK